MARVSGPGLKDVAEHAGVSISTVSRVINDGPYVTETVRARVLASMATLGYEPHVLAQSLRTGQTQSVGYVISDITNPLFATITRGIDGVLQQFDYTMFLGNSRGDAQHDIAMIKHMLRRRVDGLILSLSDETDPALQACLRHANVPLVLLDREVDALQADKVLVDHRAGVREAVHHFYALGHRRIGLITGRDATRPGREIHQAFHEAMAELQLTLLPENCLIGPFSDDFGAAAMRQLLDRDMPPTAVLAGGAQTTTGVLRAVRERGIRIPDDLSLIAYDNTDLTTLFTPTLSVVARDVYGIGMQAATLLIERLTRRAPAEIGRVVTIPTSLVVRDSTAPPARIQR